MKRLFGKPRCLRALVSGLAGFAAASVWVVPGWGESAASGLISHWRFDEGSGALALDDAGANNGVVTGALYSSDAAPAPDSKYSLGFDGVDDLVDVPDAPSLDFDQSRPMTISLWVKKMSSPSVYHILGKRDGCGTMNYQLARDGGGVHFNSADAGPGRVDTSVSDLENGIWTHIAATYDGSTLRMYVGGTEKGSASPFVLGVPDDAPLRIGASGTCGNNFPGLIDDVRIYGRALSSAEVGALAAGLSVDPPATKAQCKEDGWRSFATPMFRSQGECVAFVERRR